MIEYMDKQNIKIIHKTVVGSRLHGLCNEKSDYDFRGIHKHDMKDIFNPFMTLKNTSWIEGDEDNTSYELMDFCKVATKGNPTLLEILWSDLIQESSPLGAELRENRHKFLHSKAILDAHRGYALNQYNKMNLFDPDARTPKFAVAYIRSLVQGIELLKFGDFNPHIQYPLNSYLMGIKYEFSVDKIPELSKVFQELQLSINQAYIDNRDKFTPDYKWIADFVYRAYTG